MSLAEALGYSSEDRLLIINGDDFGLNYSFNQGIQHLLQHNFISSTSLMLPCAFAREGAIWSSQHPQFDVGVHFTFTSEWANYKWGPVTRNNDVTTLVTPEGYFHDTCLSFEQSASPSQVSLELTSQVEMALALGMKPTHADSHMGSLYGLQTGKHFLLEALDVCAYYGLPFRLPRYVNPLQQEVVPEQVAEQLKYLSAIADQKGVIIVDYLIGLPFELQPNETVESFTEQFKSYVQKLAPGVTELILHPSQASTELQSFHREHDKRVIEFEAIQQPSLHQFLQEQDIKVIHWRELQRLQRAQTNRTYPY